MKLKLLKLLTILSGITGIIQAAYYYTILPEKVASHFGPSGMPDSWMPKAGNFFVSATIFIFMTIMMLYAPKLVSILPVWLINLPNKDYWLANGQREQTLETISAFTCLFGIAINLYFIFLTHMVFLANRSQPVKLNDNAVLLALGIFMLFLAGWLLVFIRRFRKQT